jgi:hypothetical protein
MARSYLEAMRIPRRVLALLIVLIAILGASVVAEPAFAIGFRSSGVSPH